MKRALSTGEVLSKKTGGLRPPKVMKPEDIFFTLEMERVVALRAVSSVDGMTADWCHLPYDFLADISNEIINKVKGVNRVVYDISSKPPATIEWE